MSSARGAASMAAEAISTARDPGCTGQLLFRIDSVYYSAAARKAIASRLGGTPNIPPVLATELRRTAVPDRETDASDVPCFGQQPGPCLVQADLLLEVDWRHRRYRAEMAVER